MVSKKSRSEVRVNKHRKLRNRFSGTAERPRLAVFRSNNHMYAQIIDDTVGNTLVAASTVEKAVSAELEKTNSDTEVYKSAGSLLIKVNRDDIYDETKEQLETLQLRQKTMARQEERVMKKLQEMQTSIQNTMNGLNIN